MAQDVKFIILSRDERYVAELRSTLQSLSRARIVAEVADPALLAQAIQQLPVDALLVDLDPAPESILPIIGEVAAANRGLAVFAASESTDGQLILKAMRLGLREFLPKPVDGNALQEAIDRVAVGLTEVSVQGRLVTVIGTAGGVGATLLTTNLAVELAALAGGDVAAVDLDYRYGQVATFLDVDPKYSIADLCNSSEELEAQVIARAMSKHPSGVHVLARPGHLAEADVITAAACMGVFSTLVQCHEYVVSDGPTRFDVGSQSALALADVILLLVQPVVPCVRNAARFVDSMRENGYNLDRVKLVCNKVGRTAGYLSVNDVTETLGLKSFASIPDEWETASGAINLGEPLMTHSPRSKLRLAIQEIAQRLHDPDGTGDKDARKQGLIGRIFANS